MSAMGSTEFGKLYRWGEEQVGKQIVLSALETSFCMELECSTGFFHLLLSDFVFWEVKKSMKWSLFFVQFTIFLFLSEDFVFFIFSYLEKDGFPSGTPTVSEFTLLCVVLSTYYFRSPVFAIYQVLNQLQ